MNKRTVITFISALLLILLVMCVAGVMTFSGWVNTEKYTDQLLWRQEYGNTQTLKIIDLTADGQDDLFIQNLNNFTVFGADERPAFSFDFERSLTTTMGDITGDGNEDLVAFYLDAGAPTVTFYSQGNAIMTNQIDELGDPARAAVIKFAPGVQVILGDQRGALAALAPDGEILWQTQVSRGDYIRGLDDALVNGQVMLAAANHDGTVKLFNMQGQVVWSYNLPGGLRRLRAYDLDSDGNSEVLLGGEASQFVILNAANGEVLSSQLLGQAVSEIREAEIDGNPASREIIVGGKDGGIWAFTASGDQLWSASTTEKVTEIVGEDIDRDGVQEILVGDDNGELILLDGQTGERSKLLSFGSGIISMDSGRWGGERQIAIADGGSVQSYALDVQTASVLQYAPLLAGLIVSAVVLAAAWFVATTPPKPRMRVAIEDQSPESLQAQRRMLKENIADLERLKGSGEITTNAYLDRLKALRDQQAENEAAMRKAGLKFSPETFQCPNCGGSLPLGMDRCEYCGQVVIS